MEGTLTIWIIIGRCRFEERIYLGFVVPKSTESRICLGFLSTESKICETCVCRLLCHFFLGFPGCFANNCSCNDDKLQIENVVNVVSGGGQALPLSPWVCPNVTHLSVCQSLSTHITPTCRCQVIQGGPHF